MYDMFVAKTLPVHYCPLLPLAPQNLFRKYDGALPLPVMKNSKTVGGHGRRILQNVCQIFATSLHVGAVLHKTCAEISDICNYMHMYIYI